ncbi:MAG: bifunctional adenosylcobinamide kinase/adenosylcobinamide-phosphate guanylyltransferase [Bryobacteraceae bacterium]
MPLILVGGGSRSGKSSYALELARERGTRRAFVATAEAFDDEMRERIALHRAERDQSFTTLEEPTDLARVVADNGALFDVILVDCLTLWVSNLMMKEHQDIDARGAELVRIAAASAATCIFVTNEVGCGIVPENTLARRFRDIAGRLNQQAGRSACEVYLLNFGIASRLK